jgi:hypothetical protein
MSYKKANPLPRQVATTSNFCLPHSPSTPYWHKTVSWSWPRWVIPTGERFAVCEHGQIEAYVPASRAVNNNDTPELKIALMLE